MEFRQKNRSTKLSFAFGPTELTYHIIDQSGEVEFLIDYAELPGNSRRIFMKTFFRNLGIVFCVLGLIALASAAAGGAMWTNALPLLIMGAAWLGAYYWNRANYTVLDTVKGPIWILEDKQLDAIHGEIKSRRKARILEIYGKVDPQRPPDVEIAKFEWLVKERVLTREEAEPILSRLRANSAEASPPVLLN